MINTGASQILLPAKFHNFFSKRFIFIHKNKRVQFFMKHGVFNHSAICDGLAAICNSHFDSRFRPPNPGASTASSLAQWGKEFNLQGGRIPQMYGSY